MNLLARFRRFVVGQPISSSRAEHTLLPKFLGLPVFASDAISSVGYASQQIILALGAAGLWVLAEREKYQHYTMLLSVLIAVLLTVVVTSYWQTIFAYPGGGGAYIVSKDNLGTTAGLIAAAALLIDYVLTVAVSIAAGVQNLASIPIVRRFHLDHHFIAACLVAIAILTIANLRGLKESGALFAVFTYGFIILSYLMIAIGLFAPWLGWQFDLTEIDETYRTFPADLTASGSVAGIGAVVLFRAFANGCAAMTGTEAVSNGVPAFTEPKSRNAALTLVLMGAILGSLFLGISWLAMKFHVVYWEQGGKTAPAVIDQISGAVFGKSGSFSFLYLATQLFTAAILVLAANTSFADFPRLASILARDGFMPRQLTTLGDKLVFHNGILLLGVFAGILIVAKQGSVDALIPLYAVGVFMAFTFSQAGMVVHWYRIRGKSWTRRAIMNGIGAVCTCLVFIDIVVEKFAEGAWMVIVCLMIMIALFRRIAAHYAYVQEELVIDAAPLQFTSKNHLVLVPVSGLHRGILPALDYGKSLSTDCKALYVEVDPGRGEALLTRWKEQVPDIPLVVLKSPFRSLVRPLNKYLDYLQQEGAARYVTIVVPEFVTPSWWQKLLHGNAALFIKLALAGRKDIIVSSVRYHLHKRIKTQKQA